eukprot:scaffold5293_cov82-Cylindrotheca_fusiformis.AAC.3
MQMKVGGEEMIGYIVTSRLLLIQDIRSSEEAGNIVEKILASCLEKQLNPSIEDHSAFCIAVFAQAM